jgi:hypothetical protein
VTGPRRGRGKLVSFLGGALISLLVLAPASSASYDPLGSGTTRLTLDNGFSALMKKNGVRLLSKSPAVVSKGKVVSLPVGEGEMDPTTGKGEIDQEGVLIFKRDNFSLPLKKLMLKTKRSPLYAKVGGGQLKIAIGAKIAVKREGFGTVFTAKDLKLSDKVAVRLNKKLHLGDVFEEGQLIGSIRSETQPQTIAILATGKATLTPNPETFAKLENLHVSHNPVSPAELAPGPLFTFPMIPAGAIAPDASSGTLRTGGSIELLQLGAGQIFWHEFWFDLSTGTALAEVDIEPAPPYPGKLGQVAVLDLNRSAASVSSNPKARTITVTGAPLTLQAQSAANFNQAFAEGKPVFKAGDPFGTISFTAQGQ